jgi:hypothetical protein
VNHPDVHSSGPCGWPKILARAAQFPDAAPHYCAPSLDFRTDRAAAQRNFDRYLC